MTIMQKMHKKIIKPTPFGPVCIVWTGVKGDPKIIRVVPYARTDILAATRAANR